MAHKRSEKEIILEYIGLGRGQLDKKKELAKELGISGRTLRYRVDKFKKGEGVGRKKRADAGIPKKDPELKTKLTFFAEVAMGKSGDQVGKDLGLTEHQTNRLINEFKKHDKFKALRNAPQLQDLMDLVHEVMRIDMATVLAEMQGAYTIKFGDQELSIPVEQLNDIKTILAYCLQLEKMSEVDPMFAAMTREKLENVRVNYLLHYFLEKKNTLEYSRLKKAVKITAPERQMDLKLVYAIIDRIKPGLDEGSKLTLIREEAIRMKMIKEK